MLSKIKNNLARHFVNARGWKTKRKILVIESDDWGSIRMPSQIVYTKLLQSGIRVDKDLYCKYDTLASSDDLSILFETLKAHKNAHGKSPLITANTIVCNPDFDKIRAESFNQYYYEPFLRTLDKYPNHIKSFDIWKQGISKNIFYPQFHGREHLNVKYWMEYLKQGNKDILLAFNHNVFGIPISKETNHRGNFMAAFDYNDGEHLNEINEIINDGLRIFNDIFNYHSKTMMAPCYLWSDSTEKEVRKSGIIGIQGMSYQFQPESEKAQGKSKLFHYQGERNLFDQRYLVRNAFFEPSHYPLINYTEDIIKRMEISFFWKKPVILSTHRLNFIGSLIEENRQNNIQKFNDLLKEILKRWPEIEFLSSSQLIELMEKESYDS